MIQKLGEILKDQILKEKDKYISELKDQVYK
jgi:hypothetical protein